MEIGFPRGLDGELYHVRVKRHAVDRDKIPVGIETSEPITDTRLYDLKVLASDVKNAFPNDPCIEKV